jgi:3-oxoacyl-(acyl-carrier-protein) synthase
MRETNVDGRLMATVIGTAVARAGIPHSAIDYINAHGSALPDFDVCDTNAFKAAFGERAYQIPITSIKSMIGQAISASGLFQVIAACLSLRHHVLPPTINQEHAIPTVISTKSPTTRAPRSSTTCSSMPTALAVACPPLC